MCTRLHVPSRLKEIETGYLVDVGFRMLKKFTRAFPFEGN